MINEYPYRNLTDLNIDYLLKAIKTVEKTLRDFVSINSLKYADPIQWSITSQYEKNTIVIDPQSGTAYISVQPVPVGVILTNTDYWTVVFDLERFVTKANNNFTLNVETQTTLTATMATNEGHWVIWGGVLYRALTNIIAGDQYVVGSNIERITVEEIINEVLNTVDGLYTQISDRVGDLANLTTSDITSIVNAINSIITERGALSDLATSDISSIVNAINSIITELGTLSNLTTSDKTSLVNAINEVDLNTDTNASNIGTLANLTTTDKTSLVNAINEVDLNTDTNASNIGALANLTTTDKTSLVNAINEVDQNSDTNASNIGTLANLTTTDKTSIVNAINEIVPQIGTTTKKYVFIGDSYGEASSFSYPVWTELVPQYLGLSASDYYATGVSGAGFVGIDLTFLDVLQSIEGSITDKSSITDMYVLGGVNDHNSNVSDIKTAISDFIAYVNQNYSRAKIHIGVVSLTTNAVNQYALRNVIVPAYKMCSEYNADYVNGIDFIADYQLLNSDGTHPSEEGQKELSRNISNYVLGGYSGTKHAPSRVTMTPSDGTMSANNELVTAEENGTYYVTLNADSTYFTFSASKTLAADTRIILATLDNSIGQYPRGDGNVRIPISFRIKSSGVWNNTCYSGTLVYNGVNNNISLVHAITSISNCEGVALPAFKFIMPSYGL